MTLARQPLRRVRLGGAFKLLLGVVAVGALALADTVYSQSGRVGILVESNSASRVDEGLAFTMRSAADKRVTLPELTQFPDAAILGRVNAELDRQRDRLVHEVQEC